MYILACTAFLHISYYSCRKWQLFLFKVLIDVCNGDGHFKWLIVKYMMEQGWDCELCDRDIVGTMDYDRDIVGTMGCMTGT
jgi:hypothetical protein